MASKSINAILSLKDKFSSPVKKAANNTKTLSRQVKQGQNVIKKFANSANKAFLSIAKSTGKAALGATSAIGSLAAGVGFKEALDLEGYRLQLETATKDTKKASQIMKYAIDLANKTPFEGGELVEASAMFEAMGLSAKKWLPLAGDMAAATNKDFMQATEAIIDAQAGELERLKEFGIKKSDIIKKAGQMFTNIEVVNNKDQIVNQEKFNEAMIALMKDKFSGGMEKQATTMKGLWSTVTGVAKSALSKIVGITEDGTVRQGSLYETLKNKITSIADRLTQWQQDGTLDKIADKVTNTVAKAFDGCSNAIAWLKDNMSWIMPVASGLIATFIAFNVISTISNVFTTFQTVLQGVAAAQGILNFVMSLNPFGLIAIAIGAVVAAGVALWKNWDKIIEMAKKVGDAIGNAWEKFKGFLGFGKENADVEVSVNRNKGTPARTGGHATGTPYFKGGRTRINEGGRGEIVNLPNGSSIIPHDKSNKILEKRSNININVNINGNVIGNKEFADQIANLIYKRVKLARENM